MFKCRLEYIYTFTNAVKKAGSNRLVWLLTQFEHLHHCCFVQFKVALYRDTNDLNNICYKNRETLVSWVKSSWKNGLCCNYGLCWLQLTVVRHRKEAGVDKAVLFFDHPPSKPECVFHFVTGSSSEKHFNITFSMYLFYLNFISFVLFFVGGLLSAHWHTSSEHSVTIFWLLQGAE